MVLDISRLDTGALKPEETAVRLDRLLSQVATDFTPMARKKGLKLRVVPSSIVVKTDRNMLRRVIQNLVSNAIKYSRKGGILFGEAINMIIARKENILEVFWISIKDQLKDIAPSYSNI